MKTDGKRARIAHRLIVTAAVAGILAGCGQKGPLTLPSDELESTDSETSTATETSDDEENNED